jgi:acetyl/propionyl-CoA carboxylase alpha subunit
VSETSTLGARRPGVDRPAEKSDVAATPRTRRLNPRAVIASAIFLAVIGLAIWYLARPEPLLVQGEVESTRIDIAARVSGRLAKVPVTRGQDVAAGATLLNERLCRLAPSIAMIVRPKSIGNRQEALHC